MVRQARLDTLDTMLVVSLVLVGVLTVIAGVIGWLVAGQALQPLREITATARRVADRSLHERIALTGPNDEIKDLADTLDAMLERLDRSFDSQRRFVANASHELRTPLTITRTLIEVALLDAGTDEKVKQLGTTLLAVNQRHEKLTDGLLTLASSEQRAADFHPVDLGEIAGHVVSELRPVADKAALRSKPTFEPAIVQGDAFLLERLIQNLIENGIQYNLPENGWVRVRTDTGAGQRRAHRREHRSRSSRPTKSRASSSRSAGWPRPSGLQAPPRASIVRGAGLGLSIVRSVAHTHGGEVEATPREGGGLVVRVRIPAAPDAEAPNGHLMRRFVSRRSPRRRRDDDYPKTPPHPLRRPCGRGPRNCSAATAQQAPADRQDAALAYAQCMRDNGYAEFPDPTPDGGIRFLIEPESAPRFEKAASRVPRPRSRRDARRGRHARAARRAPQALAVRARERRSGLPRSGRRRAGTTCAASASVPTTRGSKPRWTPAVIFARPAGRIMIGG